MRTGDLEWKRREFKRFDFRSSSDDSKSQPATHLLFTFNLESRFFANIVYTFFQVEGEEGQLLISSLEDETWARREGKLTSARRKPRARI